MNDGKEIYEMAGESFNINSPKQLGVILFEKLLLPGSKKTKSGYSTAASVLDKLAPDYPIVSKVLEYRQLTKAKNLRMQMVWSIILKKMDESTASSIRQLQRPDGSAARSRIFRIFRSG